MLIKAIESVLSQSMDTRDFEIIVVDNGSTDGTEQLVKEIADREKGRLRLIMEPKPGLSPARNAGAIASRGDIVVYTDDDAVAHKDWLINIRNAFDKHTPFPAVVGGKIKPDWEVPPPHWLPRELYPILYGRDYGDAPVRLFFPNTLTEVNFAVERRFLQETGWFFDGLGRKPGSLVSNEGDEILRRAWSLNRAVWFEPKAIVSHHVSKTRLNKQFVYKRALWQGISDAFLARLWPGSRGSRRLKEYLSVIADLPGAVHAPNEKTVVQHRVKTLAMAGRIYADLRMRENDFRLKLTGEKNWRKPNPTPR